MLEVENLKKSYGDLLAVKGVCFSVKPGSVFAIIGPNGAGKTTILKSIMGFLRYEGKVRFNGKELDESTRIERFSFLPEEKRLYPSLKVSTVLKIAVETIPNFDSERCEKLVEDFSLNRAAKVLELSHGMRTLLYLALVVSKKADLYILDEPTWGLDPIMRKRVFEMMNELIYDGSAILYTSHVLPEVEKIADEFMILVKGEKVFQVDLETLRAEYRIAFTRHDPGERYPFFKRVEGGYLVLAKEEELTEEFENISSAGIEDVFDMMVGRDVM